MLTFEGDVGIGATGIGDKHRALRMWYVGQARAISGGEWYESGTGFFIVRYRVRITMSVELAVPIHHRGDGEVAGEGSGI